MAFQKNSAEQIISTASLEWCFQYEYNPDFDLGMGDWISDGDNDPRVLYYPCNDDLLFGKENEPTRERESSDFVTGPSAKRQHLSLKLSKKKRCLQSPVTVLLFLLTSKLVKKCRRD